MCLIVGGLGLISLRNPKKNLARVRLADATTATRPRIPDNYSSKQARAGAHVWGPTGWSSGPVSVNVRLHQQWQEWPNSSVGCSSAPSASAGMNIFLVRRCLQIGAGFIGGKSGRELHQGTADEGTGNGDLVAVLRVRLGFGKDEVGRLVSERDVKNFSFEKLVGRLDLVRNVRNGA